MQVLLLGWKDLPNCGIEHYYHSAVTSSLWFFTAIIFQVMKAMHRNIFQEGTNYKTGRHIHHRTYSKADARAISKNSLEFWEKVNNRSQMNPKYTYIHHNKCPFFVFKLTVWLILLKLNTTVTYFQVKTIFIYKDLGNT